MSVTPNGDQSLDFRLGQMTAQIGGLRQEIAQVRAEGQQREENIIERLERSLVRRLEQHDERDDERFSSLGARVGTVEGLLQARTALDGAGQHQTNNRIVLLAASIAAAAALLGAVLPLFWHGH